MADVLRRARRVPRLVAHAGRDRRAGPPLGERAERAGGRQPGGAARLDHRRARRRGRGPADLAAVPTRPPIRGSTRRCWRRAMESGSAERITEALRTQLEPTWRLVWRAVELLRGLEPGASVAQRWEHDRGSFSGMTAQLAEGRRRRPAATARWPRRPGSRGWNAPRPPTRCSAPTTTRW
ncbi:hypothetical protein ACFSTC_30260 [Nonomuraea ferruginea]